MEEVIIFFFTCPFGQVVLYIYLVARSKYHSFILIAKENNLSFFGHFVDIKRMINISELPPPDLQYIYIYSRLPVIRSSG